MAATTVRVSSPRLAFASKPLDLGNFRQRRGLSLEQIADTTKISMRFLRAIEAEDFAQLPGGIFRTSYLRQYAAAVCFEEARLLARCEHKTQDTTAEPLRPATRTGLLKWLF